MKYIREYYRSNASIMRWEGNMAGAILIGNRNIQNKDDLGLSESMSSNLALSFGDTIIPVLEKQLPEVVPEITFIYEFGDTIDFRSLDRALFNKTMLILQ